MAVGWSTVQPAEQLTSAGEKLRKDGGASTEFFELRPRERPKASARLPGDSVERIRIANRCGTKRIGIEDRENRDVQAERQRDRPDDCERKHRRAAERPKRI